MLSATSFASVAPSLIQLPAAEQCLVADQSCSQIQALIAGAQLKVLDDAQNGHPLKGISEGLRQQREAAQPVGTLHLIAHGRPGAFRIGNVWIDAEALKAHATELARWGVKTIALWSCHVGADADFVALLEELSGAQVLASADWLGRDGDGNEQLQLGSWSLADVTDASAWPASFRLASGVPDGLDPEGVRIALEGGKHWGASDQSRYDAWAAQQLSMRGTGPSGLTLEAADGTGICAEDEFLFEVSGGKANGDVSIDVDLSLVGLPEASQVWFSATGAEDSWQEYNYKKDPSELTKLSGEGTGYIKVKLPDETSAVGSDLKVSLTQYDNDLEGDNPVLDLNYERLNADGAVRLKDENGKFVVNYEAHKKWDDSETKNGAIYKDAYRYTDLYPELQKQGYRLEADVSLEFYAPKGKGVKNYSFDDKERFGDDPVSDKTYLERFQTRFDGTQGNSNGNSFDTGISYAWKFYLRDTKTDERKAVSLKNFFLNPVDVDGTERTDEEAYKKHAEYLEVPEQGVVSSEDVFAGQADIVYVLPEPLGWAGEKGPDSKLTDDGKKGEKNMIRVVTEGDNVNDGKVRFWGAKNWDAYQHETATNKTGYTASKVPGASVALNYRKDVDELQFSLGISGRSGPGAGNRFFSVAMGDAFVMGDVEETPTSETVEASITLDDCFDFYITASAACIEDEEAASAAGVAAQSDDLFNEASFTFDVVGGKEGSQKKESLEGEYVYEITVDGERVGSKYANYSLRFEDELGNPLEDDQVLFESKKHGDGTGILTVKEGVEDFRVVFDVIPRSTGDQLVGDESVTLELTHKETGKNDEATASLEDELGCDPVGSNPAFTITATAACENEETELLTDASFTFSVKGVLEPGSREPESLKGDYTYVLAVNGERVGSQYAGYDYRIEGRNGEDLSSRIVSVDEGNVGDGVGALYVKRDITEFRIVFDVDALAEGDQLTGDESVTLSLERNEVVNGYAFATASLADELGCDPLPNERAIFLEPFAACVKDGVLSGSTAEFIFKGEFKPATTEARSIEYIIDPSSGLLDGDYSFNLQLSDGISISESGTEGVLKVDEGVSDFSIEITASAADALTGDESITLTLIDDGEVVTETASLAELDCAPDPEEVGKTDVELYLLMDNSTSMLQPDPSTTEASRRDRLESQDRVSLYAYQQALEKAGYGFSRKGESGVLSEDEFKDAVINNSAADLSDLLNGFEVIVNPDSEVPAEDLTVHLITYGYAVDYGSVKITADDPTAGTRAAQAIVDVLTPDQIYGNSIDGNSLWSARNLPQLTSNDTFRGDGRPASNLYSGTEMMGALEGLEHLLAAQANRAGSDPITTYISMTTDGRPERRAWWDTRKGSGSDSLTGQDVRLPDALGGDAITTSGLNYDDEGNHRFLRNNAGKREWLQMQDRLNDSLDAIAAQAESAEAQLQVSVVGMGDGTDADFPSIYADLFGERTFINSKGGWAYDYFTSYALPDFVG